MAEKKLSLEEAILSLHKVNPSERTFDAPKPLKAEARRSTKEALDGQKSTHRTILLILVGGLCIISFLFLAFIISFQMIVRLSKPDYNGVSDLVVNILTTGVFGECIAVVAVIAKEVWKDPRN